MYLLSLAGQDVVLAAPNRFQATKLFGRIHEAACDIRPRLIVLDNGADVFAGNENDRAQVRQFVTLLRDLAIGANAGPAADQSSVADGHLYRHWPVRINRVERQRALAAVLQTREHRKGRRARS